MSVQALLDSAQAVLDRWDSPAWEWIKQGPTAALIADLRRALLDIEKFCDTHCTWADHHPDCVRGFRRPLTENQIRDVLKNDQAGQELLFLISTEPTFEQFIKTVIGIARAIERAHGIRESG